MKFINLYIKLIQKVLPSPFSIAVILTAIVFFIAFIFTGNNSIGYAWEVLQYWEMGFWDLLSFSMQMSLILLLGHCIALSELAKRAIDKIISPINNSASAAFFCSLLAIGLSFINWGLCLVFGAIMARKIGEKFSLENKKLNYPLVGAAAYTGMLAWHGGLSASAPLTVAQENHFLSAEMGIIEVSATIFSLQNLLAFLLIIIAIPSLFYFLGKKFDTAENLKFETEAILKKKFNPKGAEKIDHNQWIALISALVIIGLAAYKLVFSEKKLAALDLNTVNFILFGMAILVHKNFFNFLQAVQKAIGDISGIVIQFPIYAGIMGMMKYSGLIDLISNGFISISTQATLPIFTFMSAAIVNTFVPSGGGQWAIQGPIIIESAKQLDVDLAKMIMSMAYGDQITNMLQPFWALPLLGITKLKAKDIIAYTTIAMALAGIIYLTVLWFW